MHNHACGKAHEIQKGPQPVLTLAEEQLLEDWLVEMANIGYGRTKQQLQQAVKNPAEGGKAKPIMLDLEKHNNCP